MRTVAVLLTASLFVSLPTVAAEAQTDPPDSKRSFSADPTSGSLMQAATREAARLALLPRAGAPSQPQPPPEDTRGWVERHPVWSGAIGGAGVGAVWGVASCSGSCFPIGRGGAAIFGASWGAGIGALIGLAIGAAD